MHVFFYSAKYDIHKGIYVGYNDIARHSFQYNFSRTKLGIVCKLLAWKVTIVTVIDFVRNAFLYISIPAANRRQLT
jgi:hypothetical protein